MWEIINHLTLRGTSTSEVSSEIRVRGTNLKRLDAGERCWNSRHRADIIPEGLRGVEGSTHGRGRAVPDQRRRLCVVRKACRSMALREVPPNCCTREEGEDRDRLR